MLLNTQNDNDLLFGSNDYIAAYLGISAKQVARYKSGATPLPEMARRLLKLRYGDLAGLLDSSWQGFTFHQGELFHPFYSQGFSADEVKGWFFGRQELNHLRHEVKRLEAELSRHEKTAHWAARMVRDVSRPTPSSSAAGESPRRPSVPPTAGSFADTPPPPPRQSDT